LHKPGPSFIIWRAEKYQRSLAKALEEELKKNPLGFFKTIVMPLLPKETKLSVENDGIVEWKSLIEAFPLPKAPATPNGTN